MSCQSKPPFSVTPHLALSRKQQWVALADVTLLNAHPLPGAFYFVFTFIFFLQIVAAAAALKTYKGFSRGEGAVSIHEAVKED